MTDWPRQWPGFIQTWISARPWLTRGSIRWDLSGLQRPWNRCSRHWRPRIFIDTRPSTSWWSALEYGGDRSSVYYPTGTNPSIIAARISYQYDLRGPSWVSNTACSSFLVAIHYAAKDIEAGRIDFAIAGGVNMLLDPAFTQSMRSSGFLSKENRCKTFDDSADGYVRAEGGGLVLLANKTLVDNYYATIAAHPSIRTDAGRS
ncbi:MAG: beta-ketoacyl synthase N-terminal-like domain-containing protein [Desulfobacteraceae bacterium]